MDYNDDKDLVANRIVCNWLRLYTKRVFSCEDLAADDNDDIKLTSKSAVIDSDVGLELISHVDRFIVYMTNKNIIIVQ